MYDARSSSFPQILIMSDCIWYTLWHKYLSDDPEKYGRAISRDELLQQTESNQQIIDWNKVVGGKNA